MHKIFQIKEKILIARDKPSPVRASRKSRDCGSSWLSEAETVMASSIISAIPRTFEAQKRAHLSFRIPTVLDFTPKQEIGNSVEVAAAETVVTTTGTQVENEDNGLGMRAEEDEAEESMKEEEEDEAAERINITTDWRALERERVGKESEE
ncbi:hypothetical protein H5410_043042 [Solanum commersonii]|uniref:Uncharacterized protein n=1 Tax=Solanum commersonii TaxID=4109 RepID=A0A9J5XZ67_SOLCO|nr:hypothetical protein H5410_043042 [Solanum commersonii]